MDSEGGHHLVGREGGHHLVGSEGGHHLVGREGGHHLVGSEGGRDDDQGLYITWWQPPHPSPPPQPTRERFVCWLVGWLVG